jgi:hypothetical protein
VESNLYSQCAGILQNSFYYSYNFIHELLMCINCHRSFFLKKLQWNYKGGELRAKTMVFHIIVIRISRPLHCVIISGLLLNIMTMQD